jgi:tetratricopeptide (TPR) repeat protein
MKPEVVNLILDCVSALLAAYRLDEAWNMLSTLADADNSARTQSLLGEVDEKDGKFRSAGLHFNRALQLDPSENNAWQLGDELLKHWSFSAAITIFDAASAKFPDSKRLRVGLGAALFGAAQYGKAVPVFADLLAHNPNNAMYAELLGISCNAPLRISDPRCLQLVAYAKGHPADAKAATYAATLLLATGEEKNVESAKHLLQHAIRADPSLPEAQFQMGMILQDQTDWEGSIPWLERAVKLKPELAQAHYRLALAYRRVGRQKDEQAEIALYKKFAGQEQAEMTRRLNEVTRFAGESSQ